MYQRVYKKIWLDEKQEKQIPTNNRLFFHFKADPTKDTSECENGTPRLFIVLFLFILLQIDITKNRSGISEAVSRPWREEKTARHREQPFSYLPLTWSTCSLQRINWAFGSRIESFARIANKNNKQKKNKNKVKEENQEIMIVKTERLNSNVIFTK